MAKKENSYIELELEWLERRAEDLKAYVEKNPIEGLKDRIEWKQTKSGLVS